MLKFSSYKKRLLEEEEEFNIDQAKKDAIKWLENKYGTDLYNFKYIENLDINSSSAKVYDIAIDGNTYTLKLRKFNSNEPNELDVLAYEVLPSSEVEDEEESEDE